MDPLADVLAEQIAGGLPDQEGARARRRDAWRWGSLIHQHRLLEGIEQRQSILE